MSTQALTIRDLLRRKRMLEAHLKLKNLRPARRQKFQTQLLNLNKYLESLYNELRKADLEKQKRQTQQAKLEDVASELKAAIEEGDAVHQKALEERITKTAMLPSVFRTEEKKEDESASNQ